MENKENSSLDSEFHFNGFGRSIRDQFLLDPDFIHLNHGSYGTYPKQVQKSLHEFQLRAESQSDLWFRIDAKKELEKAREQVSKLLCADADDLVFVQNATTGINAILRSHKFEAGDQILHFNTTYNSIQKLVRYLADSSDGKITPLIFNVNYPVSNDEIVKSLEEFLDDQQKQQEETDKNRMRIRLAIIDHISSTPAAILPVEKIIKLLRSRNIMILIDAAHSIGQIPINLRVLSPDFYVTNCHKWVYAARGCSILYVDKKFQSLIHPTNTSHFYEQPANFQDEFFWTGTMDFSPFLSVMSALDFRQNAGGEESIISYCHSLALEGGKYLADLFKTDILQQPDQIACMIDVRLPISNPEDEKLSEEFWLDQILLQHKAVAVPYKHNGKWWLRSSAQIYNDLQDFKIVGEGFLKICKELNDESF